MDAVLRHMKNQSNSKPRKHVPEDDHRLFTITAGMIDALREIAETVYPCLASEEEEEDINLRKIRSRIVRGVDGLSL